MSRLFEELDYQQTPIGVISLRRRLEPTLKIDVFEIKIGEDGLMSSLITDGEEAVSSLALAATSNESLDVVVGGLGLGYTAQTRRPTRQVAPRCRCACTGDRLAPASSCTAR
jgi:hypothetical protein